MAAAAVVLIAATLAAAPVVLKSSPDQSLFAAAPSDSLAASLVRSDTPGEARIPGSDFVLVRRVTTAAGGVLVRVGLRNSGRMRVTPPPTVDLGTWVFRLADPWAADRYSPLSYRADQWYGSTYWTGPDWTRVGKDWQHPGIATASVRVFTAPETGAVTVTGRVRKADLNGGDGISALIQQGTRIVWRADLAFNDGTGVEPTVRLALRAGEQLRFVVHKRGEITCDTTLWDPVIAYADGRRFQASESFAEHRQGAGGWSYECASEAETRPDEAIVRGYRTDASVLESPVGAAGVRLASGSELPAFWLADRGDRGGLGFVVCAETGWHCGVSLEGSERVAVRVTAPVAAPVPVGSEVPIGAVLLLPYSGRAITGVASLDGALQHGAASRARSAFALAARRAGADPGPGRPWPELGLWWLVASDWAREDRTASGPDAQREAFLRHDALARMLLGDLRPAVLPAVSAIAERRLQSVEAAASRTARGAPEWRGLLQRLRWAKRSLALANPLLPRAPLLFCKRRPPSYSHLVMQYFGWRARPGGGLFLLKQPGYSLATTDILSGRLPEGSVLEPRLSFDARRIVFSYVACGAPEPDPLSLAPNGPDERYYHIYEVGADGRDLRQITRGPYDDVMPTYLPDGAICFSSTRRKGYARCFGPAFSSRWHVYTLHRVERNGSGLRTLSFHDTNEWFPAVGHDGRILYSRWDYIDRDAVTHQNLWATRPDGTNPVAVWGNATRSPHCTFQLQPVPGSHKVMFTASAHHSVTGGAIAVVDPARGNDGLQAITRLTPEVPFPEAESMDIREFYASPWPLSERYFIASYSPYPLVWEPGANRSDGLGLYLVDGFGNRELLYRDAELGCTSASPLVSRPAPPVVAPLPASHSSTAELLVQNVARGLGPTHPGDIRSIRVVQILPKSTPQANSPPVGIAGEENGRIVLGEAPVEADGSARFTVPARKPLLFQAIDAEGQAYQTMRTVTYLQPGERLSCVGCHEPRGDTVPGRSRPMASRRPPSRLALHPLDGEPFSYIRSVQPVLDRRCVSCHSGPSPAGGHDLTGAPLNGFSRSYWALCGPVNPQDMTAALVPRFPARNQIQVTPPGGRYGARGSRLMRMLRDGHGGVRLTADEMRRIAVWIDCNAIFFGTNDPAGQAAQLRGERAPVRLE